MSVLSKAARGSSRKSNSVNKLTMAFTFMVVLFLAMTSIGIWTLTNITGLMGNILSGGDHNERLVREWLGETRSNAVRAVVLARTSDGDLAAVLAPEIEATTKNISALQKKVEDSLTTPESKELFAAVGERRKQYLAARGAALASRKAGNHAETTRIVDTQMIPAVKIYIESIQKLANLEKSYADSNAHEAIASAHTGRVIFVGAAVFILILAGVILLWIVAAITRPLLKSLRIVDAISGGDLSRPIRISSSGESRRLIEALEGLRTSLAQQVRAIQQSAVNLNAASSEIERGNNDLSRRTEAQASALEQTASSLEQLTAAVEQNSLGAQEAERLATEAGQVAQRGGEAALGMVDKINGISESSKKIADIIGVIDGIAFQTNILSLNAAVEAARAGEQGRGFAVVASEVRALAQRSAEAAKQIKMLVEESVNRVELGVGAAKGAGKTMNDMVASSKRVSDLISEIAAASREQLSGLEQIGGAVTHLDDATQQNAALVEQTAAAASGMTEQVGVLLNLVEGFRLENQSQV